MHTPRPFRACRKNPRRGVGVPGAENPQAVSGDAGQPGQAPGGGVYHLCDLLRGVPGDTAAGLHAVLAGDHPWLPAGVSGKLAADHGIHPQHRTDGGRNCQECEVRQCDCLPALLSYVDLLRRDAAPGGHAGRHAEGYIHFPTDPGHPADESDLPGPARWRSLGSCSCDGGGDCDLYGSCGNMLQVGVKRTTRKKEWHGSLRAVPLCFAWGINQSIFILCIPKIQS